MKKLGLFFTLLLILIIVSCEIGLGSSVDTEVPTISIENPPADAKIREAFMIDGNWSDDGAISKLSIELKSNDSKISAKHTFEGTLNYEVKSSGGKGTWYALIDPIKEGIKDGTYEATVTIVDSMGHKTSTNRSYTIDNTKPVIKIERPSSIKNAEDSLIESYGQYLTLTGEAYDDNDIATIKITFYDADIPTEGPWTTTLTGVSSKIDNDIAKFSKTFDVNNIYSQMYGNDPNGGTHKYYCTIETYDGTKRYPPKGQEKEDDDLGNPTNTYLLDDDLQDFNKENSALCEALKGKDQKFKVKDLYAIKAGNSNFTSDRAVSDEVLTEALEKINELFTNKSVSEGSLKLNPKNNPSFSVSGLELGEITNVENERALTVQLSKGLDGIKIDRDSLKVYLIPVMDPQGNAIENADKIYLSDDDAQYEKKGDGQFLATIRKKQDVNDPEKDLVYRTVYIIGVEGEDIEGNKMEASLDGSNKDYRIRLKAKNIPPELTITKPEDTIWYTKKGDSVVIEGTTSVPDGQPTLELRKNGSKDSIWTYTVSESDLATDSEDEWIKYNFSVTIPDDTTGFAFSEEKTDKYVFEIVSTLEESSSSASKTIVYDIDPPTIQNYSLTSAYDAGLKDGIKTYYIDNRETPFTLTGIAKDNLEVGEVSLTIKDKNGTTLKQLTSTDAVWTFESNSETEAWTDLWKTWTDSVTAVISVKDKAGNETIASKDFRIIFDTEAPVSKHCIDTSGKDLYFRIGEQANDDIDSTSSLWNESLDKDVGGKYKSGTFGNKETIKIRGNFEDGTGSGVKMIYYKLFTHEPTTEEIQLFLKNYESPALSESGVGYFSPLAVPETKRIFYTDKSASGDVNDGTLGNSIVPAKKSDNSPDIQNGKFYTDIVSTYKTMITGFTAGHNYLALVAVDNVGHAAIDSVSSYCINVDTQAPETLSAEDVFTDGSADLRLAFTVNDKPDGQDAVSAGVNKVSVKMESLAETKSATLDTTLGSPTNGKWVVTIPVAELPSTSGSYAVSVTAVDGAGEGNSDTRTVCNVIVDKDPPEISNVKFEEVLTSSSKDVSQKNDYYYVNNTQGKQFRVSGVASDNRGVKSISLDVINTAANATVSLSNQTLTNPAQNWNFTVGDWSSWTTGATLVITATDKAGLTSSQTLNIAFDTVAPTVNTEENAIIVPNPSQTENSMFKFEGAAGSLSDAASGLDKVEIAFTSAPASGSSVEPTVAQATVTPSSNGSWSSTVEFANAAFGGVFNTQGTKYLWVKAYDKAGNASAWTPKAFKYDTAAPEVSFTDVTPAANSYRKEGFKLEVNASDSYGVDSVTVSYGTETAVPLTLNTETGKYEKSFRVDSEPGDATHLDDGKYTFTVHVTDKSGKSSEAVRTFSIDTIKPVGTFTENSAGTLSDDKLWFKSSSVRFAVNVIDANIDTVEITKDGTVYDPMTLSSGSYSATLTELLEGEKTITVKMKDHAGNENTTSTVIYVDTTEPSLNVNASSVLKYMGSGGFTVDGTVRDSGSGVATLTVTEEYSEDNVNFEATPASGAAVEFTGNNWTKHLPLGASTTPANGYYRYKFILKDKAGNSAEYSTNTTVDVDAPEIIISSPTDKTGPNAINASPYMFSGTVTEANEVMALYYKILNKDADAPSSPASDVLTKTTWTNAGWTSITAEKNWSFYRDINDGTNSIREGLYNIYMYVLDGAGNLSARASREFHVDMASPVVEITNAPANVNIVTNNDGSRKVVISGTVTELHELKSLTINGTSVSGIEFNTAVDNENWTYEDTPTEDGTYTYTIVATDKVEKTNTTLSKTIDVDITAPTIENLKINNKAIAENAWYKTQIIPLSVTADDVGTGISSVEYATLAASGTTPEESDWTSLPAYGNNIYSGSAIFKEIGENQKLFIRAKDKVGNIKNFNNGTAVTVNIDTTAPDVIPSSDNSFATNGVGTNSIIVTGTANDAESGLAKLTVTVIEKNVEFTQVITSFTGDGANKTWTATIPVSTFNEKESGMYTIYAQAVNNAELPSSKISVGTISVDTDSPNVTITSPEADAKVGEAGLIISGSADDRTGSGLSTELVKIYYNIDDPASAESWHELGSTSSGANWTFTKSQIPVAIGYPDSIADDGANTAVYFKISVKDKAGNIGYSEPRRIIIDRKKPTFDIGTVGGSTATDGWFNTRTINIAGNFEDIGGSGVTSIYYKIADSDSVVIPTTDGSYNRNITIPEDATNPITLNIWARDAAGNEISSTDSGYKAYTLNIDSTTPTLTANYFVKGSEEISIPEGTIYKKSGATTFTLYGNYQDDANGSGIKVLKFKNDGEDISPTVTYSTNTITSAASATDASYATYNINSAKTYKSWKAVFSITEGGRITVEGEDIAGNKTTTLSALDIAVDNDAPAISNVKLNVTTGTNSNEVYSDGTYYYLNNTVSGKTFTITGLATDNIGVHKVNLSITNTATTNTATALTDSISNPNGSWSFEVDDWSDWETGATATVTVTDKAGNSATPVSLNIVFDITKPEVISGQLKTPTPIQTENNLFKFEGLNESVTDSGTSSGFDKVEIAFTNAPVSGTPTDPSAAQATATLDANGSWSSTVEFANESFSGVFNTQQGTKYLWVRAYDNAGNVSDWKNKAFVYDTGTPTISFTNTTPVADSKRKEGFTLEVEANDSYGVKTVTVTYAEGMTPIELTEQSTGNLYSTSFRVGSETGSIPLLTDGDYTFTVIVEDNSGIEGARGKTNTVTRKITVDTTAPSIDMTSASVTRTADFSNWHKVNQIPVSVNVSDVSGVSSVQVSTDGTNFTEPSSLRLSGTSWIGSILCDKQGENKIYFKAIDAVGNETTVDLAHSISVYIDTEAPGTPVFLGAKTTGASTIPVSEITSVLVNKEKALTVYGAIIDSGDASNATGIPVSGTDIFRQKGKTSSESVSETFTSILAFTPVLEVNHTYSEGDVVKNTVGSQNKLYVCTTAHTTAGSEPFVAANWKDISEYSFWSYEIPTTDMSNGGINFTVKDNAGNKADYTLFQMTVDTLPPTVTVTPLSDADYDADGTQINGIISIIGNASDENGLSTTEPMKLYYTTSSTLTANPTSGSTGNIGTNAASNWVEIGSIAHANSWSFNNIDTAKLDGTNTIADNTTVYFKVVAKDKAGNTKYSDRITAIVDQDTDRPIIKFTNLILNAMSSSAPLPFETNALYGSVTDDDGIAIDDNEKYQFYYQSANSDPTANDTNWIQIKLSNGTLFTLTLPDGKKNLYFKVVDTGKTSSSDSGTVFITSATDAYNQSTPKLTDSAVTPNTYGYRTSGVGKIRTVTYLKVDIKTPEAKDIRFTRTTSNTNSWNNAISDELFGGTHNIFHLQQLAFDENGVEKVYLSIPANAADGDLSGLGSDGVVNWINIDNATGITSTVYTNGAELIAGANYWITSDITQTSFGTITSVAENHASITIGSGNDAKVYTRKPVVVTSWVYTNEDTEETQTVYTNGNRPSENANYWNDNVITGIATGTISGVSSNYTEITIGTGNNAKTYIRSAYIFPLEDTEPNSNNKFHLWQTPADQPIDVTNFASVNRIASLVTFDGIRSSSNNVTVNIDNTPVTIKINGPANETQAGSVTVLGQINDRAEVYYAVSTSDSISPDSKTPVTTWKNANDVSATISELTGNYYKYKKISKDNAELSWSVSFDENGAPSTEAGEHQQILNKYLVSYGITTADQLNNYNELVKLYVWIKAVDERGNQAETVKEIVIDPQGDRPEVKFSYPSEDGKTYGGQVQLTGSANDKLGSSEANKGVESLWLQIVSKKHQKKVENEYQTVSGTFGTFTYDDTSKEITSFSVTKDDLDFLKDKYDIYNMKTYHEESTHTKYSGTLGDYVPSDYAIRITPEGSSWNATVNEQVDGKGEFDYKPALADTEKTNGIALRLYAQDKDGKFSSPKYRYMIFDSQNPVVGNEQKLYLIHSSSDAITTTGSGATATPNFGATASKEYTKDMFVRGSWYLIGSVSDNDKIKQLKIGGKTLVTIAATDKDTITEQPVIATNTTDHYSTWVSTDKSVAYFKYKLNTAVGVGNLQFDIYAEDFASPTTGKTTQTMYVKYDNKSPDLVGADDSAYKLSPYVVQKNGFYRIESKVKEDGVIVQGSDQPVAQSGFDFVAFYFMRRNTVSTETEVDTIYNPMLSSGNSDTVSASTKLMSASGISEGEIIYDSGLYWRKMTVERTNSLNTLNISSTENDKYIRKNGLVSIGGSLYKIIEKTTSSITINGNPPQNETTAYFALALLADHSTPETASTLRNSAGYPNTITGDDGDGFVDYVEESGTSYTWSAELVSKNIPDGPIELHYVAFDTAGNYSIGIMGNITEATYRGSTLAQTPDRKEYQDLYNAGDSRTSNILYVDGEKSYYNAASAGSEIAVATYKAAAFVQNNAPRIAALTIWTDYNGDNSAAGANNANETKVKYCQQLTDIAGNPINYAGGVTSTFIVSGNNKDYIAAEGETLTGTAYMTIRDKTTFTPEIVGGNNNLHYMGKVGKKGTDDDSLDNADYSPLTENWITASANPQVNKEDYMNADQTYVDLTKTRRGVITISADNLKALGSNSDEAGNDPYWFEYKIWDSTEGTTPGTNSLSAVMRIALNVQYFDETEPWARIKPFYWNSRTENSVVWSGTGSNAEPLGHIELEDDVSDAIKTSLGETGENDILDPKVSGKIKVEGYAYDNIRLKELYAKFTDHKGLGNYTKIASYNGSWTGLSDTDNGWSATVEDVYSDETGHKAHWTLIIDTSKVTEGTEGQPGPAVVGKNRTVTVFAVDARGTPEDTTTISDTTIKGNTSVSDITNAVQTTETAKTPLYQMDVVPYITGVTTELSSLNKNKPSIYNRSALGHYPVRYIDDNDAETVIFSGFNLSGAEYQQREASKEGEQDIPEALISLEAGNKLKVSNVLASSEIVLKVGDLYTINNLNNNDAKGSYNGELDYEHYYNRQPNGYNNNLLTDDVVFDVWNIDPQAVRPKNGVATQPVMKIDPKTDKIGFAFVNANVYFSMPYGNNSTVANINSYEYWLGGLDFWNSISLAYDSNGNTYGTAAGGDLNANKHGVDTFSFFTSRWGKGDIAAGTAGYTKQQGRFGVEFIGEREFFIDDNGNKVGFTNFSKERIKSPSLAAVSTTDVTKSYVYLAYYDSINDEIRFKWGVITNSKDTSDDVGMFANDYDPASRCSQAYSISHSSLIAGHTENKLSTTVKLGNNADNDSSAEPVSKIVKTKDTQDVYAGEYVCIAVIPGEGENITLSNKTIKDDVVVAVWWDGTNHQMLYSYNTKPKEIAKGEYLQNDTEWSKPVALFPSEVGEYCKVAVAADKSVHIAAYDSMNGDLWYAYLPTYNGTAKTGIVDSAGFVGSELNIDVALNAKNKPVPYISYYALSASKPKIAIWKGGDLSTASSVVGAESDFYTSNWEVSVVPTKSKASIDNVNVGVWKENTGDNKGVIKDSEPFPSSGVTKFYSAGNGHDKNSYGNVYGNGTANPVLGYAIKDGALGYIETAQMK